jgi:hypothetical protein
MMIDPASLSPISALFGALMGGTASLLAAIYTQRKQDRLQRIASEVAKREAIYADFVAHASNLLLNAYLHDEIVLTGDEHRLMAVVNRMRFFAPSCVMEAAERVLKALAEIALQPSIEFRKLMSDAISKGLEPDPLLQFSVVCRADLDGVRRGAA